MINFKEIRQHLKANTTSFKLVAGVTTAGQSKAPTTLPAVFVLPAADNAEPNGMIGVVDQKIDEAFICMIYAKNARQGVDNDVADDMQLLKAEVRDALMGWQPSGAETSIELVSGETDGFDDHIYAWSDLFTTNSRIRKT